MKFPIIKFPQLPKLHIPPLSLQIKEILADFIFLTVFWYIIFSFISWNLV
jgi:hypothetical protein